MVEVLLLLLLRTDFVTQFSGRRLKPAPFLHPLGKKRREDMKHNEKQSRSREKLSLLWTFLKGAKRYFLAAVLSAGVTALADMIQP